MKGEVYRYLVSQLGLVPEGVYFVKVELYLVSKLGLVPEGVYFFKG